MEVNQIIQKHISESHNFHIIRSNTLRDIFRCPESINWHLDSCIIQDHYYEAVKNINTEIVFEAIEQALVSAAGKHYGEDEEITFQIDRESGAIYGTHNGTPLDPEETIGRIGAVSVVGEFTGIYNINVISAR